VALRRTAELKRRADTQTGGSDGSTASLDGEPWLALRIHPRLGPDIATAMFLTLSGRLLSSMRALTGCPTSCSEMFLTEHGRKLCPLTNWSVADSIPER